MRLSKLPRLPLPENPAQRSLPPEITGSDDACSNNNGANSAVHDEDTLAQVREICMTPLADPAETFLMDILSGSGDFTGAKTTMSIKFFLPEEIFDLWNTVFTIWLRKSDCHSLLPYQ
ncbi:MAG: hypothetical protein AB2L14_09060 [Candidatus Xenobiia bacterium LiM19]